VRCSSNRAIYFACRVINVWNSFPFTVSFTVGFKLLLLLTYCMIGGFWGVGVGEFTTHFVRVIRVLVFDYAFHQHARCLGVTCPRRDSLVWLENPIPSIMTALRYVVLETSSKSIRQKL